MAGGISIEHHCPQCGAPVFLDETDRFFACPYCRVKSCIAQKGFGRYYLTPHKDIPKTVSPVFLPYWRFKGVQYACTLSGVDHWFTDVSVLAIEPPLPCLPFSLGFRSQALTLKRVSSRTQGIFVRPQPFKESMNTLSGRSRQQRRSHAPLITEDIGETFSLIYAPYYEHDGKVWDGVLNIPLGPARNASEPGDSQTGREYTLADLTACRPEKETRILSGVCPGCGWDLEGQSDSLALVCRNCHSLWQPRQKELDRIRFASAAPTSPEDVLVPFWKMAVRLHGLSLNTYADLALLCNLPRVVSDDLGGKEIFFWAPAFKIRPRIFLTLSRQFTLAQPTPDLVKRIHKNPYQPVTLPASEALQSIKITLASLIRPTKDHLPQLAATRFKPVSASLIFLPFEKGHHELIHRELNLAINTNVLKLSGNL